ncbi:uncharacterized protein LOC100378961 [Saccoglossus kowalevskii]|uniref:Copine family protein 2-like n=1 Tax=Saccoglossus kowalevskii TaxID=10224 RepID=A0ABM0GP26_SACKO|nr:PREDICTED: copine family protein 2-like [Saccoglossus kowalevskii]
MTLLILDVNMILDTVLFICAWMTFIMLYLQYQKEQREKGDSMVDDDTSLSKQELIFQDTSLFACLGFSHDEVTNFTSFTDRFSSFDGVASAIKRAGLHTSHLIVGIDFTASNEWQGRKVFGNKSLHHVSGNKIVNPYQKVIAIIGGTLEKFDSDNLIPVYGFGDTESKNVSIFPVKKDWTQCRGFGEVLRCYNEIVPNIKLSGPTSFAPVINKAIEHVRNTNLYHILLIITDGQLKNDKSTVEAIVEASNYALSIILVGVGDGPWGTMRQYDDMLPKRKFDNFQFVDFHKVCAKSKYAEPAFALHALMEVPDQYKAICELGYLNVPKDKYI